MKIKEKERKGIEKKEEGKKEIKELVNSKPERLNRRSNRSNIYQYIYAESSFPHEMLDLFSDEDSIYKHLNPFAYNEDAEELKDELNKEFWRLANENLSQKHMEILELTCNGLTQIEIAKKLEKNQSSITKILHGNVDYSQPGKKKTTGGIVLKMKELIETDDKIQVILRKLSDIRG